MKKKLEITEKPSYFQLLEIIKLMAGEMRLELEDGKIPKSITKHFKDINK